MPPAWPARLAALKEDSKTRCMTPFNYEKHETREQDGRRPSIFRAFRVFRSCSSVVDGVGFGAARV
jgi:hypothetical protein